MHCILYEYKFRRTFDENFQKMAATIFSAVLLAVLSVNVSAERYAGQSLKDVLPIEMNMNVQPDSNSNFSDGATAALKTGNSGGHFNIMLAAGLALLTKFAKK